MVHKSGLWISRCGGALGHLATAAFFFSICLSVPRTSYAQGGPPPDSYGSESVQWMAVFLNGNRVGHLRRDRAETGGEVILTERLTMEKTASGEALELTSTDRWVETVEGEPRRFERFSISDGRFKSYGGKLGEDGRFRMTVQKGGPPIQLTFDWPPEGVMVEGRRLIGLEKGLKMGTSYKVHQFVPETLEVAETSVLIGETREVEILGKTIRLTEVLETSSTRGRPVVHTVYVDSAWIVRKMVAPDLGSGRFEMIESSESLARGAPSIPGGDGN